MMKRRDALKTIRETAKAKAKAEAAAKAKAKSKAKLKDRTVTVVKSAGKGSHYKVWAGVKRTTVPKEVSPDLLKRILAQLDLE